MIFKIIFWSTPVNQSSVIWSTTTTAETFTIQTNTSTNKYHLRLSPKKDLSIQLDANLSYNTHITRSVSTCLFKLKLINRIKYLLDRKTLFLLMNVFIFGKLLYCSSVWSNTSHSNIDKLQKGQNFAGCIVLGLWPYLQRTTIIEKAPH